MVVRHSRELMEYTHELTLWGRFYSMSKGGGLWRGWWREEGRVREDGRGGSQVLRCFKVLSLILSESLNL